MKIRIKAEDLTRRNHVVADMMRRDGPCKPRVWKDKSKYTRKVKHRKGEV